MIWALPMSFCSDGLAISYSPVERKQSGLLMLPRRLWLDRYIDDHQAWLARRPEEGEWGADLQD